MLLKVLNFRIRYLFIIIISLCYIFYFNTNIFAEFNTQLSEYNYISTTHQKTKSSIQTKDDWFYGGGIGIGLLITPKTNIAAETSDGSVNNEPGFRYDYLVNLLFFRDFYNFNIKDVNDTNYNTTISSKNDVNYIIKEVYADLIFYDYLSIKSGFSIVDYGYNGYFHPLNIVDFVPQLKRLYDKLTFGNTELGFIGSPSIKAQLNLPQFMSGLTTGIRESIIFLDKDDLQKNYSITDLSFIYNSLNISVLCGPTNGKEIPILGGSFSYLLPFDILSFIEVLYKRKSLRPYVKNDIFLEKRQGSENFFNVSFRMETTKVDPVFKNNLKFIIEYFYYGEGLTKKMYDDVIHFFTNDPNNINKYYNSLFLRDRNFIHNVYFLFEYGLIKYRVVIGYELLCTINPEVFRHKLYIAKQYNSVSIMFAGSFSHSPKKYELIYGAQNCKFDLNLTLDF